MATQALSKKMDYTFSQYYHNCDLINKYNLVSFDKKPQIKQLVLKISLEEITNSFITKNSSLNDNNIQIISFLFIYVVANVLPFIKLNDLNLSNKNLFSLKVAFNNEQQILKVLHDLHFLKVENVKDFNLKDLKKNSFFILTETCKADKFFELESLINKHFKNININELNLSLVFKFSNLVYLKSSKNFVQNFPFLSK